jgi:TP901 family phage tail tape measure protein
MAERVVAVTLRARVSEYNAEMAKAAQVTRTVGTEAEKLAQTREAMQTLGSAGTAMGATLAAGVGVAIGAFARFDQAMSYVAATGADARGSLDELRAAAIEAGASTVFSATEAANAIEEMAKAGVSAKDILGGGLKGALDLAAAGGLGVAQSAEIASTTMQQFSLEGKDASHVADLLAAGAGKAMGDVTDMAGALNQSGLVASQFGLSVEETTGTLAAFAQAGMLGSDAGTSLRTMLLRMANPTKEVAGLMEEIGFQAYDASGNFIGMAGLAGELASSLKGMTQAQKDQTLAMIFGQDAIRGANILLREGEDGINGWTRAVNDQGYAAKVAAERLDNLIGDWEAFTGALETAFITMGEGTDGPLRLLVQSLSNMVDGFNELPDWAQQLSLGLVALAGGIGLVGGGALVAIPKIAQFRLALDQLNVTRGTAARGLRGMVSFLGGPWGLAMLAATAATVAFNAAIQDGIPSQVELKNAAQNSRSALELLQAAGERGSLETTWMGDYRNDLAKLPELLDHAISAQGNWADALNTTIGQRGAYDSLKRLGEALAGLASDDLPAAQRQFRELVEAYKLTDDQAAQLLDEMPALRDAFLEMAGGSVDARDKQELLAYAMGDTAEAVAPAKDATEEFAKVAEEAQQNVDDLAKALENVGGTAMGMGEAMDQAQGAINAMSEAAKAEGTSFDGTNDASIKLRDSMRDVEQSHRDAAQAIIDNGGTYEDARAEWAKGRDAIIDQIAAMTGSRDEAVAWAEQNLGSASQVEGALSNVANAVNAIPTAPVIKISMLGYSEAYSYLSNLQAQIRDVTGDHQFRISPGQGGSGGQVAGSANGNLFDYQTRMVQAFAGGGFPTGVYAGGAPIHKFAEPETIWESYISGKPDQRDRNIAIWEDTGRRLGVPAGAAGRGDTNVKVDVVAERGEDPDAVGNRIAAKVVARLGRR